MPVQRQCRLQARAERDEGVTGHGMLRGLGDTMRTGSPTTVGEMLSATSESSGNVGRTRT
jgi:hypothetical protein